MELDDKLCYCFHVSKRKVVNFVRRERPRRASQISECFGAGTGCGWCIPFLRTIHREIVAGDVVESDDVSAADYEAMRGGYLCAVRDGKRDRNRHADSGPGSASGARPAAANGPSPTVAAESHPEPDVSDYFSRPARSEPLPDELGD